MTTSSSKITVEAIVNVSPEKAWEIWNQPEHITKWCQASEDWHAPFAEADLRVGGKFTTTMAAKDGSFSFDFGGVFDTVQPYERIEYTMGDGRKVKIVFQKEGNATKVIESFDPEGENDPEFQKSGWQAILNNYKKYAESV